MNKQKIVKLIKQNSSYNVILCDLWITLNNAKNLSEENIQYKNMLEEVLNLKNYI